MEQLFGIPVPPGTDPSTVLAVHPTQIYEAILMLAAFMLLWSLRKGGRPIGWIFGLYLVIAGVERFLIEILRAKDDRFLGPFTLAQLTSVVLIGIGIWVVDEAGRALKTRHRAAIWPLAGRRHSQIL